MTTMSVHAQKSAGDFDYDQHGHSYTLHRRTDLRIARLIHKALGSAKTVLNVGAGAGSYEPQDRYVVAIEPSAAMRAQRPVNLAPAIDGIAEELPLDERSVDTSMALMTVHQWSDFRKGLGEMRRVTRGAVIVMTFDADAFERYWLADYVPELIDHERRRFPSINDIRSSLGGNSEIQTIPIPIDCEDGFNEAYYARPEKFLEPAVRASQSAWGFVKDDVEKRFVRDLEHDFKSGIWNSRYGEWRQRPFFEGSLRLIVATA